MHQDKGWYLVKNCGTSKVKEREFLNEEIRQGRTLYLTRSLVKENT